MSKNNKYINKRSVLLVGELSGVSQNLRSGFLKLGIDCKSISYGNNGRWTSTYDMKNFTIFGKKFNQLAPFFFLPKLMYYDLVIVVDKYTFNTKLKINQFFMWLISSTSKKSVFWSAACDSITPYVNPTIGLKNLCKGCLVDQKRSSCNMMTRIKLKDHLNFLKKMTFIVSSNYTYTKVFNNSNHVNRNIQSIPLPIELDAIPFYPAKIKNGKLIKIFHGITRPGFKGSNIIKEALIKLEKKYPNLIKVKFKSFILPEKYLEELKQYDIIVDQLYGTGIGMNSLICLAMGKLVITGQKKFYEDPKYIINYPGLFHFSGEDLKSVEYSLSEIIININDLKFIPKSSREFIRLNHSSTKIAKSFLNL